jgi:ABC-2 type transport system ATP-binding protein
MIRVDHLTKIFSGKADPAIDSVSFDVSDGEIVGFVGLNGAGKTTTIRVAAGVSLPTSGTVSVDGYDVVGQKVEASRRIGWVPELPNFEPNASAIALMRYFAGFYDISGSESTSRSLELLKSVGLGGAEARKLRTYSQGMKKRFSLAASLLSNPTNYLFDEVLNGLDPEGIRYFRRLVAEVKGQGASVLMSSHILLEVQSIADRVVIIHKGKVIKTISRSELESAGDNTVKITFSELDNEVLSYLKGLGDVSVDGKTVFLRAAVDTGKLNSDLVNMGLRVTELTLQKEGLEEYFLKLIGEEK